MEELLLAYDWLRLMDAVNEQLGIAKTKLSEAGKFKKEQGWLSEAQGLLTKDQEGRQALLDQALLLPELASVRREHAAELVAPWADALEHLHAGIVFHAGLRSPLLEALFPHKKFEVLRRADLEAASAYGEDFLRRLKGAYVDRLLAHEDFAFAKESVAQVEARYAALSPDAGPELEPAAAEALRQALTSGATQAELLLKQARLLAEAALCPVPGVFAELSLRSRPKPRAGAKPKKDEPSEAPSKVEVQAAPEPAPEAPAKKPKKPKKDEPSEVPAKVEVQAAPAPAPEATAKEPKKPKKAKDKPEAAAPL